MGRFLSVDPFQGFPSIPLSLNKYGYSNIDPINRKDPTGLVSTGRALAAAGIVGVLTAVVAPIVSQSLGRTMTSIEVLEASLSAIAFTLLAGTSAWIGLAIASVGLAFALTYWLKTIMRPGASTFQKQTATGLLVLASLGLTYASAAVSSGSGSVSTTASLPDRSASLLRGQGVNLTPRSMALKYRTIGRGNRSFITDLKSIEDVVGPIRGSRLKISKMKARRLEAALGLRPHYLERINVLSVVDDVPGRAPASPISGNDFFLGGGAGLPGGGPELTVRGIPSAGGHGIRQIIVEVTN